MIIETKFSLGDVVWAAQTKTTTDTFDCPDCMGAKTWKAVSPAGGEYEFKCPRCSANYGPQHPLSLRYTKFEGYTQRLTIGQVRGAVGGEVREPIEYMCRETGVGSGALWKEDRLFATQAEAQAEADRLAEESNAGGVPWVKKQYDEQLALCDYELGEARSEEARKELRRARYAVDDLVTDMEDAVDLAEAKDAVERFQKRLRSGE